MSDHTQRAPESPAALFERPLPQRTGPHRTAGHFYRGSPSEKSDVVGGLPLNSVEAAVISAVRTGYKIAAAQIERTERFTRRLRDEGDRTAGPESGRQALDATEDLLFRTMMSGLGFLEGAVADRGNPIARVAAAQYRLLGSLLGLLPDGKAGAGRKRETDPRKYEAPAPVTQPPAAAPRAPQARRTSVQIQHAGTERRPVRVREFETNQAVPPGSYQLQFYSADIGADQMEGELKVAQGGSPVLIVRTSRVPAGEWKAAVCDDAGNQIAYIVIEL